MRGFVPQHCRLNWKYATVLAVIADILKSDCVNLLTLGQLLIIEGKPLAMHPNGVRARPIY